jgi:lipoic acid synthetase
VTDLLAIGGPPGSATVSSNGGAGSNGGCSSTGAAPRRFERKPPWLKVRAPGGESYVRLKGVMRDLELHTVCEEAQCPNVGECWGHGVATFMILGDVCTRGCRYCAVSKGTPRELDLTEPDRVADAVRRMGLGFVVVTSVDRDDLPDGGASIFAETVRGIRSASPATGIELLTPDFQGSEAALRAVLDAGPDVLNHNVETVPRLYRRARGGGVYDVSLRVLENVKRFAPAVTSKTGMMLGLGETRDEVREVMRDLVERGVEILTLGQYLRPSGWHLEVERYVHPDEFRELAEEGRAMGFRHVEAGPLVRSSYRADRQAAEAAAAGAR